MSCLLSKRLTGVSIARLVVGGFLLLSPNDQSADCYFSLALKPVSPKAFLPSLPYFDTDPRA